MSDDSGSQPNYWPGFVDALSNVVLTLVFVLVVFVFALMITSGKVKHKAVEMVEQGVRQEIQTRKQIATLQSQIDKEVEAREKASTQLAETQAELKTAQQEVVKAKKQLEAVRRAENRQPSVSLIPENAEVAVQSKPRIATASGTTDVGIEGMAIVINFPQGVVLLNDAARAELNKVIGRYKAKLVGATARITSFTGTETYSEGRRHAYFRALDVRNYLITNSITPRRNVVISTKTTKEAGDARVEIRFVHP